jgi:AcrR family transcriptional regulator
MVAPWRTDALQSRSRSTERRILAAATELIGKHGFADLPVAAIARRARISIGGLYARYANKDALVHAVDEVLIAEFDAALAAAMDPTALAGHDVAGVVEAYVGAMVAAFAARADLMRQVVLRARSSGDPRFTERVRAFNLRAHGALAAQLLARRRHIAHPDPEAAVAFGVMFVSAAAREAVLFGSRRLNLASVHGRQLVRELVRAYCAYLGAPIPKE